MPTIIHSEAAWALTERLGTALASTGHTAAQTRHYDLKQLLAAAGANEADAAALHELDSLEVTQGEHPLAYVRSLIYLHMAAYRPRGGARAGAGKPKGSGRALDASQQARYADWLERWRNRPHPQQSAYALAKQLNQPLSSVRHAAAGTKPPSPALLDKLEKALPAA